MALMVALKELTVSASTIICDANIFVQFLQHLDLNEESFRLKLL